MNLLRSFFIATLSLSLSLAIVSTLMTFNESGSLVSAYIIGTGYGKRTIYPSLMQEKVQVNGIQGRHDSFLPGQADIIYIASPHDQHFKHILQALTESCSHIIVEKPLALTMDDMNTLLEATQRPRCENKLYLINHAMRYFVPLKKMAQMIRNSESPIKSLRIHYSTDRLLKISLDNWAMQKSAGGGMVLAMATHFLDYVQFVAGGSNLKREYVKPIYKLGENVAETGFIIEGWAGREPFSFRFVIDVDGATTESKETRVEIELQNGDKFVFIESKQIFECYVHRTTSQTVASFLSDEDKEEHRKGNNIWTRGFECFNHELIGSITKNQVQQFKCQSSSFEEYIMQAKFLGEEFFSK